MENKKTSIEWLLENLINEPFSEEDFKHNFNVWNKAEEMHKQEIIDAHLNGQAEFDEEGYRYEVIANSEQYYNETYGK